MLNQATDVLYTHTRNRGQWGQFWSALTGRSRCLLALDKLHDTCTVHAEHPAGIKTVPICQIRGSEGRTADFDRDFHPLQDHNKGRWLSVATACQQGKTLPPVELVQVEDVYFVRDGHHRISVARALGWQVIEARVVAWEMSGPQHLGIDL